MGNYTETNSIRHAKSESEYLIKLHKEFLGYHNPKLTVPNRYLMILFTAIRCENFGFD